MDLEDPLKRAAPNRAVELALYWELDAGKAARHTLAENISRRFGFQGEAQVGEKLLLGLDSPRMGGGGKRLESTERFRKEISSLETTVRCREARIARKRA